MDEKYKMGDAVLGRTTQEKDAVIGRTTQEKDSGVTLGVNMKVSEQCRIAAAKGNQILGLIRRTITYRDTQLIVPCTK